MASNTAAQPLRTLHGSSGAWVALLDDDKILKTGGRRVVEQGQWLMDHTNFATPVVKDVTDEGYTMMRYVEINRGITHGESLVQNMLTLLNEHIWSKPANVHFIEEAHTAKVRDLLNQADVSSDTGIKLFDVFKKIDWGMQIACLTHGDPTLDNVMARRDGSLVLIDPIPATRAVPDLRCVDLGKILQSCVGFEKARYGKMEWASSPGTLWLSEIAGDNEARAAKYWCAVHLLRAIPYMKDKGAMDRVTRLFTDYVGRL
ncbi:MAG: hypothetical protein WBC29_01965 [Candidatus Moraniibacteriota bacterium]